MSITKITQLTIAAGIVLAFVAPGFLGGVGDRATALTNASWTVAGWNISLRPQTAQAARVETQIVAGDDQTQWALDFLAAIGNTNPSPETLAFVVAWQQGENTAAQHNPLATTQPWTGDSCFNYIDGKCGVRNYQTRQDGLDATVTTISNGAYPNILAGIQTSDPERALNDIELSTWGTGRGNVESNYRKLVGQPTQPPAAQATASDSRSYVLQGDVGTNVRAALNANGGKMRNFTLQPGETWSFGKTIAPISAMGDLPVVCGPAGCYDGGGWCDLGAMFVRTADQLGLETHYPQHGGVSDPQMPGLLFDEWGNGGDLTITNTTGQPVTFTAVEHDGMLTVSAS